LRQVRSSKCGEKSVAFGAGQRVWNVPDNSSYTIVAAAVRALGSTIVRVGVVMRNEKRVVLFGEASDCGALDVVVDVGAPQR